MAEYLLSVHHDYDTEFPSLEEMQPVFEAVDAFNQKVRDAGVWVFAGGLSRSSRPRPSTPPATSRSSPTGRTPRRRSGSAASGSSRPPTSTPR